ncbi:hypothetical protein [Streptomyces sp. NPDC060198]|uniref:hypothetical protein n=1 Tax=Streptomyces sp. NPDC060198 TaxID=3347070 RepID=UPI003665ED5E
MKRRLFRFSGGAAGSVDATDAVAVLVVSGLLEIRTLAKHAPAENGLPDQETLVARVLMIAEICHGFPASPDGSRKIRERRAAHALAWRYSCSDAEARHWIRDRLRDRGQEYERALEAVLKADSLRPSGQSALAREGVSGRRWGRGQ